MNCNFPELLAHDLDASNSVFAKKRMSAGAPSVFSMNAVQDLVPLKEADLHLIDPSVPVCLDEEGYTPAPSPDIRYYTLDRQATPLEPIDEGSIDGAAHDRTAISHHAESDWDSLSSSSHPSSTMEPLAGGPLNASVVTAATSTASGPMSAGLADNGGSKTLRDMSWIDPDSDTDESPDTDSDSAPPIPLRRRLQFNTEPDPVSSRETDICPHVDDRAYRTETPSPARSLANRDNYTLHSGRVAKRWPSRRRGVIRFALDQTFPAGFPNTLTGDEVSSAPALVTPGTPPCSSPTFSQRRVEWADEAQDEAQDEVLEPKAASPRLPSSIRSGSCAGDSPASEGPPTKDTIDAYREPLTPLRPMPSNIQTWVETSTDAATKLDDQLPGIPLPPDVIDNLRISISCFPDTMLLTSSLSIETIRSYSRKVKSRPSDLKRDFFPPPSYSPKKWGFSRFISSRRSNASSCDRGSRDSTEETPASPWTPLRAVFPSGSEYLCDALYAHIVAYNYISSVQRCVPASPSKFSQKPADDGEVPRKAATVLGLREADASSIETPRSPSGTSRGGPSDRRDGALRDLLVGLSRCIARLLATLRDGSGEFIEEGGGDVDLFFVRALCEVVRCSEER